MPGKAHVPDLFERLIRGQRAGTSRTAGGFARGASPQMVRDRMAASQRGSGQLATSARLSHVQAFPIVDDSESSFTLDFVPVVESWNLMLNGLRVHADEFGIVGRTLTIVDATDLFLGADTQGSPWDLEIQYDYLAGVPTSPREGYPGEVLADSPRFYYRLDEPSGTSIADYSPNNRTGTLTGGATYSQASCLTNDADASMTIAQGNYVSVAETVGDRSSSFTIEFWDAVGGGGQREVFFYPGRIVLALSGGQGDLLYYPGGVLTRIDPTGTDSGYCSAGAAYHVVTYDGSTVVWYKDGAIYRSVAASVTLPTPTGAPIHVGPTTGNAPLTRFDEVAYYDHALSAARVAAHWEAR